VTDQPESPHLLGFLLVSPGLVALLYGLEQAAPLTFARPSSTISPLYEDALAFIHFRTEGFPIPT
jgi:hypothetical protein